jgi:type I restriction enzyme M protein
VVGVVEEGVVERGMLVTGLMSPGFEPRNNMAAAEYKHVVLGLIFLKHISDTYEEHRAKLLAREGHCAGANPEDPDESNAANVFWVPADSRGSHFQASAKPPTIGETADDAWSRLKRLASAAGPTR